MNDFDEKKQVFLCLKWILILIFIISIIILLYSWHLNQVKNNQKCFYQPPNIIYTDSFLMFLPFFLSNVTQIIRKLNLPLLHKKSINIHLLISWKFRTFEKYISNLYSSRFHELMEFFRRQKCSKIRKKTAWLANKMISY